MSVILCVELDDTKIEKQNPNVNRCHTCFTINKSHTLHVIYVSNMLPVHDSTLSKELTGVN